MVGSGRRPLCGRPERRRGGGHAPVGSAYDLAEVESWPLREYLASGGDPRWFAGHTKSLMNRHLDRLNYQTLEKLRLPIPGARHYVMPTAVAQRAGIEVTVPKGHIHMDAGRGTAWVNDADWLSLPDSPQGAGHCRDSGRGRPRRRALAARLHRP
jgi:hypothetical protein